MQIKYEHNNNFAAYYLTKGLDGGVLNSLFNKKFGSYYMIHHSVS